MNKDDSIRIRISKTLKQRVIELAEEQDVQMSDIARFALREYLEAHEARTKEKEPRYRTRRKK